MISSSYQTFRIQDVSLHVCCRAAPQPASGKTLTLLTDDDDKPQQKDDLLGLDVWPASLALADHVLTHHRDFAGQCIELGAGTGIPGVLLATQRAQRVVLTDYEEHVLRILRKTIAVNRVGGTCTACRLDWSCLDGAPDLQRAFDLVLAADVVYTSAAAQPCAHAIDTVLADDGVLVNTCTQGSVWHLCPTAGLALVAHQVRHAVYFDADARKVVTETQDGPLERFKYDMLRYRHAQKVTNPSDQPSS